MMTRALFVFFLVVAASGCSNTYLERYQRGVDDNRLHVSALQIGMSRSDVDRVMGAGDVIDYKRIRLRNPWKVEKLKTDGGKTIEILYYVTDGYTWGPWEEKQLFTPVLLENDRVVGWGWAFVEKAPKYVSGPAGTP